MKQLELLQRLSGAERPERFAARLGHATAGNPFFLAETLRHLAEQQLLSVGRDGLWCTPFDDATQDYRELPVPASVPDGANTTAYTPLEERLPLDTCLTCTHAEKILDTWREC